MSTNIEGIYFKGNLPVSGATVTAQSVDGYSEGSATTDSNGRFSITGLTDRSWLAKATSDPVDGTFYLLPNPVKHITITSVEADQHHVALVGFLDSSGKPINPAGDDRIQIADDGVINADFDQEQGGILSLSIDQIQIDHGEIGGTFDDDHPLYLSMVGRSGGQELHGGVDSGDDLTLRSTTHGTPGNVYIGNSSLFDFDEATGRLSLPSTSINGGLLIGGDVLLYRDGANELRTPDALTVDGQLSVSDIISVSAASGFQIRVLGQGSTNGIMLGLDAQWYRASANVMRTPDSLVVDGVTTLTGNVTVGGTVDGVDIAARDHAESHTVASHSDTTGTGSELNTLTDGSETTLHSHAAGSGSMTTVKEGGSQVGGADIVTLDFGAGFDLAETPDTEINITLDFSEVAGHDLFTDFVANEHLLVGAIDHDSLLNFVAAEHKLEAAIDHDALTNFVAAEHKLEAAIDHDALTNFASNEHFSNAGAFPTTWSDTSITGAELETLSDGSDADSLHVHPAFISKIFQFPAHAETLATGVMGARPGTNTGESGEHGTYTALRATAFAGTVGSGSGATTILIEADDNPAFSSATTLFTLTLTAATEVADASLDNSWASGDIFVRARCTAVEATPPKDVNVEFIVKEKLF